MTRKQNAARRKAVLGMVAGVALLVAGLLALAATAGTQAAPLGQATTGTPASASTTPGTGGSATPGAGAVSATGTTSPSLASGRLEYVQNGCANCHGSAAQGGIGPALAGRNLPTGFFLLQLRTPRGVMPPYPASIVPDEEVAGIAAFVNSLPTPNASATVTVTGNMTTTARNLGEALAALNYLQSPDMRQYLSQPDLATAIQQMNQALKVIMQAVAARGTPMPGTPTPGLIVTPAMTAAPIVTSAPTAASAPGSATPAAPLGTPTAGTGTPGASLGTAAAPTPTP